MPTQYEDAPVLSVVEPQPAADQKDETYNKLKALLASRKFWAAAIGLMILVLKAFKPDIPVTEEQITTIVYVLMAYILGTAIEDHGIAIAGQ